ncbi:universal stress protein [Aphanothece hegewaldii CCALA 016]|uniref:Universal stress protein n=1 Tax=Aphanothece hegewaldii CCALA 016 TaxID=2107694 RepID=A0A2T1LUW9_9CHRO|nr:universal stress protein [Aphanothece hegewaldii]PSF35424.1 universal stress protein [Aphanothece hegewaldii CCALA 016]
MFNKILVAIDMSEGAKDVYSTALSLVIKHNANLILLHVLSHEEEYSPLPIPPNLIDIYPATGNDLTLETWRQQWEEFEFEGLEMLKKRAEEATKAGIQVEYQQIYGSSGQTICQLAQDSQVDLIIVGRRGRSGLSELLLGSVSNYVLHHAPCSVLIVQLPGKKGEL